MVQRTCGAPVWRRCCFFFSPRFGAVWVFGPKFVLSFRGGGGETHERGERQKNRFFEKFRFGGDGQMGEKRNGFFFFLRGYGGGGVGDKKK